MWYYAEGKERPAIVDETSSKKWVYVRRDIHAEERIDEMAGETYTVYVWLEMKIAKDSWGLYKAVERNTANIDYIAMVEDIEIEDGEDDE
jgi:hypothetical protein